MARLSALGQVGPLEQEPEPRLVPVARVLVQVEMEGGHCRQQLTFPLRGGRGFPS